MLQSYENEQNWSLNDSETSYEQKPVSTDNPGYNICPNVESQATLAKSRKLSSAFL